MTQRAELQPVLEGIAAARQAGFAPIKLNAVIERGVNEREIPDLVAFARAAGCELRFIEYMDVGNANRWTSERLVPKAEILAKIASAQAIEPVRRERGSAPSMDYAFTDGGGTVGVIASVTEPFCGACTRARITADGRLVTLSVFDARPQLEIAAAGGRERRRDSQLCRCGLECPRRSLLRAASCRHRIAAGLPARRGQENRNDQSGRLAAGNPAQSGLRMAGRGNRGERIGVVLFSTWRPGLARRR